MLTHGSMLGMGTPRRGKIARTMLIWTVMAVTAVTVAGCTQVVKGRAVLAGPKVGQPIEWGPCRVAGGAAVKLPGGAQCGKLAVPVDYRHRSSDAATLGLIRFPATGDKVGSLVINPGGPGESGIEAALGIVQSLPQQVRERFDLVGFDPRGVAASRPAIWCNSDADNDRLRTETQADYSPAGVAHMEEETKEYVDRCMAKMGKKFLANVGTDNVARDLGHHPGSIGRQQADVPGLFLWHTDRLGVRRGVSEERPGDDPRRCNRPQHRPGRVRPAAGQGFSGRVQRLRERLCQVAHLPTGHRPGQSR